MYWYLHTNVVVCLQKNQNAPRPSEHPPVRGKNIKALHGRLAGRCNDFAPSRQKNCHRQKQPSRRKKKKNAPSRHEQQNTPPRRWKLETNTTCLFFSLSCCTFISYCSLVRSIFKFLVFGWWSLSHTDTRRTQLLLATLYLCHSLLAFFDSQGAACHVLAF